MHKIYFEINFAEDPKWVERERERDRERERERETDRQRGENLCYLSAKKMPPKKKKLWSEKLQRS